MLQRAAKTMVDKREKTDITYTRRMRYIKMITEAHDRARSDA
jgi:hypothetical protein